MDTEALERLLMDRALGGLTPDVERLLAAYLEHDSPAAARATEFQAAATATRQVLAEAAPATLPPYPAVRLEAVGQARRRLVLVRNIAGLAAALVLGVGLGGALFRHAAARSGDTSSPGAVPASIFALASVSAQPADSEGFWSVGRLYERSRNAKRAEVPRVFWDSSVQQPRLGAKS